MIVTDYTERMGQRNTGFRGDAGKLRAGLNGAGAVGARFWKVTFL